MIDFIMEKVGTRIETELNFNVFIQYDNQYTYVNCQNKDLGKVKEVVARVCKAIKQEFNCTPECVQVKIQPRS